MNVAWTKHLKTEAEKEQYRQSLTRVKWVIDDLKKLIHSNLTSLEDAEISPKSYENPSWSHRQAHTNGYKQCLRDFNKLLTLDPEEKNG